MNSQVPFIVSKRKTEQFLNIQTKENAEEETQDKKCKSDDKNIKKIFIKKFGNFFLKNLRVLKHQLIIFDNTF